MWEEEHPAEAHVVTPERKHTSAEFRNQHLATQSNAFVGIKIPARPQDSAHIIHELDAAADIIQWELEQENRCSYSMNSTRKKASESVPTINLTERNTNKRRRTPSIADEIAAAADIARWEHEHEEEIGMVCIVDHLIWEELLNVS